MAGPYDYYDGDDDTPEMRRALMRWNRRYRTLILFVFLPLIGFTLTIGGWLPVIMGKKLELKKERIAPVVAMTVGGPTLLCGFLLVRCVIARKLIDPEELRTEEEDERQRRLWKLYVSPSNKVELVGLLIGLLNLLAIWTITNL